MTYTRYSYVFILPVRTRQDKTRQELYLIHHTEEKTLTKGNTTYVRYKRPLAKKLI